MRLIKLITIITVLPSISFADDMASSTNVTAEEQRVSVYHTREEKREAGLGAEITEWLSVSGLIEVEGVSLDNSYRDDFANVGHDTLETTVQLGFDISVTEEAEAEIILEFTEQTSSPILDEAFVNLDMNGWGLNFGRLYVPFGIYYSHFITGPMLEFGETQTSAIVLGYDHNDLIEASIFIFNGDADKLGAEDRINDWGASLETTLINNRFLFGASYLSDLADSDEQLLSDFNNYYQRRVGAWSTYAVIQMDHWDLSMESLQAKHSFAELDMTENKPKAWNVEIAYYPQPVWELSARIERSSKLPDEPQHQVGLAFTWRAYQNISVTFEYLQGKYKQGFAFDDDDNELDKRHTIAGQLTLEF